MCFSKCLGMAIFAVVVLSGCAKENMKPAQPIEVKLKAGGECISNAGQQISAFVDGRMSADQVSAFWDCVSSAVHQFQTITTGDRAGEYSPQALRDFMQMYFIRDQKVSDDLLASVMHLKRVFLAGSVDVVTKAELNRLQELIGELKSLSLVLHPHVRILFQQEANASDAEVQAAATAMQSAVDQLGLWLKDRQQNYTFDQLGQFITALGGWLDRGGNHSHTIDQIQKALVFVPDAKGIFIGGDHQQIDATEWTLLARTITQTYYFYLSISYAFKDGLENGFTRAIVPASVEGLADILDRGVQRRTTAGIPLTEWHSFFDHLVNTGWLPSAFKTKAMDKAFQWFLRRVLGDGHHDAKALDATHVAALRKHLDRWTLVQQAAPGSSSDPVVLHFEKILTDSPPLEWDAQGRMIFSGHPPTSWSLANRLHLTFPFVFMLMLKEAYAPASVDYLTQDQMDTAVKEVLPLLKNFGWLLDADNSLSAKRFREADLFTSASNGDGHLDLTEAVRYLSFITSALRSAQVWLDVANIKCGGPDPDCVRGLALDPTLGVLAPMPKLQAMLSTWGGPRYIAYMQNAEITILGQAATGSYGVGSLLQVLQLFEYVETFMQRFDADNSQTITLPEALTAYPLYGPTLNQLLAFGVAPDSLVLGLFTFMLKYGNTPEKIFGGYVEFINWQLHKDNWELDVERDNLMSILAELSKH